MDYKVVLSPQAIADVEGIVRKIAKDNPIAAERVGYALLDRVNILRNFPFLGSSVPKKPGIRKLVSYPYLIFYRPRPKEGVSCATGTERGSSPTWNKLQLFYFFFSVERYSTTSTRSCWDIAC